MTGHFPAAFTTPVTRESSVSFANTESVPQSTHTVQNQACCKCACIADAEAFVGARICCVLAGFRWGVGGGANISLYEIQAAAKLNF